MRTLSRIRALTCGFAFVRALNVNEATADTRFDAHFRAFDVAGADNRTVLVADLQDDGRPDIVALSRTKAAFGVLLGHGDGTCASHRDYSVPQLPTAMVLGDFDEDGHLDAAVVTSNGIVATLKGLVGGDFAPRVETPVGVVLQDCAVADLNGDGHLDLALADAGSNVVRVLLGRGDGTFTSAPTNGAGSQLTRVKLSDVNGDGQVDIVTSSQSGISVFGGLGDGTFAPRVDYVAAGVPKVLAVADVNRDGRMDVVAPCTNNKVSTFIGQGDGTLGSRMDWSVTQNYAEIAIGDLNGDGKPDLAMTTGGGPVASALGAGDGTYAPIRKDFVGEASRPLAVADINEDGRADIVTGSQPFALVSVLAGNGDGTFGTNYSLAQANGSSVVTVADVNQDGRPDVIAVDANGTSGEVMLGQPQGMLTAGASFATGLSPDGMAIADVNRDGDLDIIMSNAGNPPFVNGSVSVLLGHGDGTFEPRVDYGMGRLTHALAIADLNEDTWPDVIVANVGDGTLSVALGTGAGAFGSRVDYAVGDIPVSLATDDIDENGTVDILVGTASGLRVFPGDGAGGFGTATVIALGHEVDAIAVKDLNGDGHFDVASLDEGRGDSVVVLLGDGSGVLNPVRSVYAGPNARRLIAADVDRDGIPDLLVANEQPMGLGVFFGRADATYGTRQLFGVNLTPFMVGVADMDGDGHPDIVTRTPDAFEILRNIGPDTSTATTVQRFLASWGPRGIVLDVETSNFDEDLRLEHSFTPVGPWTLAATLTPTNGGSQTYVDANALRDVDNYYRLVVGPIGGSRVLEVLRVSAMTSTLSLVLSPSPSKGPVEITFSLASAEHILLRVYDSSGRVVASVCDGNESVGVHRATWRTEGIRPGAYWAVLRTAREAVAKKVAIIR